MLKVFSIVGARPQFIKAVGLRRYDKVKSAFYGTRLEVIPFEIENMRLKGKSGVKPREY
jgi:hypothetical protein